MLLKVLKKLNISENLSDVNCVLPPDQLDCKIGECEKTTMEERSGRKKTSLVMRNMYNLRYFSGNILILFFKHKKATPPRPSVKEKVFEHYVTFARMTDM